MVVWSLVAWSIAFCAGGWRILSPVVSKSKAITYRGEVQRRLEKYMNQQKDKTKIKRAHLDEENELKKDTQAELNRPEVEKTKPFFVFSGNKQSNAAVDTPGELEPVGSHPHRLEICAELGTKVSPTSTPRFVMESKSGQSQSGAEITSTSLFKIQRYNWL